MTSAAADLAAVADVGLLDPAWAGSRAEAATADRTFLGHLLDVEAAWVRVLARHGLATEAEAAAAAAAGDPDAYDLAALARIDRAALTAAIVVLILMTPTLLQKQFAIAPHPGRPEHTTAAASPAETPHRHRAPRRTRPAAR